MKIAGIILFSFLFILSAIYFFTGYKSAFEADQKCHYFLNNEYPQSSDFGCDHDLETRQWLLFKTGDDNQPSTVLKRFRY
tara:strand:- start:1689 stop:1928 length:240 start_codon:yes stop_codon:yes gene_type:complete